MIGTIVVDVCCTGATLWCCYCGVGHSL